MKRISSTSTREPRCKTIQWNHTKNYKRRCSSWAQHSAAAKAAVAEAAARLNSEEATSATLLNFVDRRFPDGLPPAIKQKLESVSAKLEAEWQQLQKRDP